MPRAEPGSLKAISNAMKAKGLQKLKWYCQMCEKQCRDENGFKCHCESEAHQRQMALFAANSKHFINDFSRRFEKGFMDILRRSYRHTRVRANTVYNDYIQDKHHVYMNSTQWSTLSEFVKHLGKEGKCIVENTPKGWYISYIEEDPVLAAKMASIDEKERMDADDEVRGNAVLKKRMDALMELQRKREELQQAQQQGDDTEPAAAAAAAASEDDDGEEDENYDIPLGDDEDDLDVSALVKQHADSSTSSSSSTAAAATTTTTTAGGGLFKFSLLSSAQRKEQQEEEKKTASDEGDDEGEGLEDDKVVSSCVSGWVTIKPAANTTGEPAAKKARTGEDDGTPAAAAGNDDDDGGEDDEPAWIRVGMKVKILAESLKSSGYFNEIGVIKRVIDDYVAELSLLSNPSIVLRVDQDELELQ